MSQEYSKVLDDSEYEDSGQDEVSPPGFWIKKQREIITNTVDYNLSTLSALVNDGVINLKPDYQRRHRWDDDRQSKLVESFLMNIPVPPIYLNETSYGKYAVIDGKQRLTAIQKFFAGGLLLKGLVVFPELNGKSYLDLPITLQNVLRTRPTIRAIIILRQSDKDVKYEVFTRLNTGGVKLNAQEIRNSAYPGPLNDMIVELSSFPKFQSMLGISNDKGSSKLYREMRDVELVLRFITLSKLWKEYQGNMKNTLDAFMDSHRLMPKKQIKQLENDFHSTLQLVDEIFGTKCFRRWVPESNSWRRQVVAAIYDANMIACYDFLNIDIKQHKARILDSYKKLFKDPGFQKSISVATNNPESIRDRITKVKLMISSIVK